MNSAISIDPCWNKQGIWGDRRCELLVGHTHCRNCERFHEAATEILDRHSPDTYHEAWKQRVAKPQEELKRGGLSLVLFRVGIEWLALPTVLFVEIGGARVIHTLPHRSSASVVEGVVNIGGEILIAISLAKLLGLSPSPEAPKRFLVASYKKERVAFGADEVRAAEKFSEKDLKPLPTTVAISNSPLAVRLLYWEGKSVGVIDEGRFFSAINQRLE